MAGSVSGHWHFASLKGDFSHEFLLTHTEHFSAICHWNLTALSQVPKPVLWCEHRYVSQKVQGRGRSDTRWVSTLISWWGAEHCRAEAPQGSAWVCLMTYSAFLQTDHCQSKLILTWHLFWKLIPIESKQMILCFLFPQGAWWDFGLNGFGAQDVVSSLTEIYRTLFSEHLLHFLSHLKSEMFPTVPTILQVL